MNRCNSFNSIIIPILILIKVYITINDQMASPSPKSGPLLSTELIAHPAALYHFAMDPSKAVAAASIHGSRAWEAMNGQTNKLIGSLNCMVSRAAQTVGVKKCKQDWFWWRLLPNNEQILKFWSSFVLVSWGNEQNEHTLPILIPIPILNDHKYCFNTFCLIDS